MALRKKKDNKLWIWKAYDSNRGKLLDWECGDRDNATLEKLLKRLEKFDVVFYFTDGYEPYRSLLPKKKLFQGKDGTHAIERNNGRQRHWFARFRRKSIVVSKTKEMVNITMAIFAAVVVNKTVKLPVSIYG